MNDKLKAFIDELDGPWGWKTDLEKLITDDRKQLLTELLAKLPSQIQIVKSHPTAHQLKVIGYNDALREFRAIIEKKRKELL